MDEDLGEMLRRRRFTEAFDLLVERFKNKVFRLALSILRDENQAEDAAQETFVRVWRGLPNYHGGASLSTWIYAIARNTCLTELKKRNAHPTVSLEDPEMEAAAGHWTTASDKTPGAELDVETLLSALPEKYRRVVILFYLEQKAYDEIAAMLGVSLGAVKTLLFRAKKELLRIGARPARGTQATARVPDVSNSSGGGFPAAPTAGLRARFNPILL